MRRQATLSTMWRCNTNIIIVIIIDIIIVMNTNIIVIIIIMINIFKMRYEAFGQSPVEHGVMDPTGEKMTFKTMSVFVMTMALMIKMVMATSFLKNFAMDWNR